MKRENENSGHSINQSGDVQVSLYTARNILCESILRCQLRYKDTNLSKTENSVSITRSVAVSVVRSIFPSPLFTSTKVCISPKLISTESLPDSSWAMLWHLSNSSSAELNTELTNIHTKWKECEQTCSAHFIKDALYARNSLCILSASQQFLYIDNKLCYIPKQWEQFWVTTTWEICSLDLTTSSWPGASYSVHLYRQWPLFLAADRSNYIRSPWTATYERYAQFWSKCISQMQCLRLLLSLTANMASYWHSQCSSAQKNNNNHRVQKTSELQRYYSA